MPMKNWLKYLIYILIIIGLIYLGGYILTYLKNIEKATFKRPFYQYDLTTFIVYAVVGLLMGLEYFLKEKRKKGKWKINLPKLIVMGLPSLYFSLCAIILYLPLPFVVNILMRPMEFFLRNDVIFINIFQLLFGYVIITSLYKVNVVEMW